MKTWQLREASRRMAGCQWQPEKRVGGGEPNGERCPRPGCWWWGWEGGLTMPSASAGGAHALS